jgi:hypothetical protein
MVRRPRVTVLLDAKLVACLRDALERELAGCIRNHPQLPFNDDAVRHLLHAAKRHARPGHGRARVGVDDFALDALGVSVSDSLSGRHWELDQVPAVGDPTHIVQLGTGDRLSAGEGQRRVPSNDAWLRGAL